MPANANYTDEMRQLKAQIDIDSFAEYDQRDRHNRPLIDGKPYRRPSTVAGALDDKSGLVDWKAANMLDGAAASSFLLEQWKLIDPSDRQGRRQLMDEFTRAAGGDVAAGFGSLMHAILEIDDLARCGLPPHTDFDQALFDRVCADETVAAIRQTYPAEMQRVGVEIIGEYIECVLVNEEDQLAGTTDRIVRVPNGKARILDLKGVEGSPYRTKFLGWQTQLAIYAGASHLLDVQTGAKSPLPDNFDRDWGYICTFDRVTAEVTLYEIDLRPGREMLDLAIKVEHARNSAINYAKKVVKPLPAGQTDGDIIAGRIAVLRDADGFGLEQLLGLWQQAGLPKPSELTQADWPRALAVTDQALTMASIVPPSMADAEQRLANLPLDLRNGVEAHSKWCDRSISEQDTEAALLQAGIDLDIAETAYAQRRELVQAAAQRVDQEVRPAFREWMAELNIDVADPMSWTKQAVRVVDALSRAVEDGFITADGQEFVDGEEVGLTAVRDKHGKTAKGPWNEAAKAAAKWLGVKAGAYDATAKRPELVAFDIYQNQETP